MRRTLRVSCLTMTLLFILVAISSPSFGQEVDIKLKWDNVNNKCEVDFETKGNRFKGVCRSGNNPKKCDDDHLTWVVKNENCTSHGFGPWKLQILDAPGHPTCFRPNTTLPSGVVEEITQTGNIGSKSSGPPSQYCSQDKYGTYWPYVLSLHEETTPSNWNLADTTDPGGIIFP